MWLFVKLAANKKIYICCYLVLNDDLLVIHAKLECLQFLGTDFFLSFFFADAQLFLRKNPQKVKFKPFKAPSVSGVFSYEFLVNEVFSIILCELIGHVVEEVSPRSDWIIEVFLDNFPGNFEVGMSLVEIEICSNVIILDLSLAFRDVLRLYLLKLAYR